MFVQSAEFIKRHQGNKKDITIYGQESNGKTYKLARMNLAIRGLNCDLGDMDASTFISDKIRICGPASFWLILHST